MRHHLQINTSRNSWNTSYNGGQTTKTNYHVTSECTEVFRDDMAVINGVVIKGQHIVIPEALQQQALKQLHINHIGIEKNKLLAHEIVYWIGMYADIENHTKNCSTFLHFQLTQPREKIIHHNIPGKVLVSNRSRHVYIK